jgi:hypothetical protein
MTRWLALENLKDDMETTYENYLRVTTSNLKDGGVKKFLDGDPDIREKMYNKFDYTSESEYWKTYPIEYFDDILDKVREEIDLSNEEWLVADIFDYFFSTQINNEELEENIRDEIREQNKRVMTVIHPWQIFNKPTKLSDEALNNILSFI